MKIDKFEKEYGMRLQIEITLFVVSARRFWVARRLKKKKTDLRAHKF